MTENIFDIVSTREAALICYLTVGIGIGFFTKGFRDFLFNLLANLFGRKVGLVLFFQILYVMATVYCLFWLGLWNHTFLKDTLFWFFTSAIVTFFNMTKAENTKFFIDLCKENLKWAVFIDFLVNFYTFSIWTELILLPTLFFLTAMSVVAETDKKHVQTSNVLKTILGLIGLTFILVSAFKTLHHLSDFLTIHTLVEFLLPPILSVLLIPFFYVLALYMKYETLFVRINSMLVMTIEKRNLIKKEILRTANISLNKISLISKSISKFDLHQSSDVKTTIKALLKTPIHLDVS